MAGTQNCVRKWFSFKGDLLKIQGFFLLCIVDTELFCVSLLVKSNTWITESLRDEIFSEVRLQSKRAYKSRGVISLHPL
jgi:hypothetical protein